MTIGQSIQKARRDKGYTVPQLAFKAGVGAGTIKFWEMDKCAPNLVSAISVANVLNITLDELVGRSRQ